MLPPYGHRKAAWSVLHEIGPWCCCCWSSDGLPCRMQAAQPLLGMCCYIHNFVTPHSSPCGFCCCCRPPWASAGCTLCTGTLLWPHQGSHQHGSGGKGGGGLKGSVSRDRDQAVGTPTQQHAQQQGVQLDMPASHPAGVATMTALMVQVRVSLALMYNGRIRLGLDPATATKSDQQRPCLTYCKLPSQCGPPIFILRPTHPVHDHPLCSLPIATHPQAEPTSITHSAQRTKH